jgi:hypothetical protein
MNTCQHVRKDVSTKHVSINVLIFVVCQQVSQKRPAGCMLRKGLHFFRWTPQRKDLTFPLCSPKRTRTTIDEQERQS